MSCRSLPCIPNRILHFLPICSAAAFFVRFFHSLQEESVRAVLQPSGPALFLKAAGSSPTLPISAPSILLSGLSIFVSHSSALFRVQGNLNSLVFKRFRTLCQEQPGMGYPQLF
jgi:hypothetical protein